MHCNILDNNIQIYVFPLNDAKLHDYESYSDLLFSY